jgi:hypothetical protein
MYLDLYLQNQLLKQASALKLKKCSGSTTMCVCARACVHTCVCACVCVWTNMLASDSPTYPRSKRRHIAFWDTLFISICVPCCPRCSLPVPRQLLSHILQPTLTNQQLLPLIYELDIATFTSCFGISYGFCCTTCRHCSHKYPDSFCRTSSANIQLLPIHSFIHFCCT